MNLSILRTILWGDQPVFPNLATGQFDELPTEGLTMGTLFIGRQGTGKTSALARHIVSYFNSHPDRAIFVLDWSGSITDIILKLVLQDKELLKRVVYDELGHPDWVIPLPEFSHLYGSSFEEQVQRVSVNLQKLSNHLVEKAPVIGGAALTEIAVEIFRLLTAITNEHDETWQITEAKKLLIDTAMLSKAAKIFGYRVPEAKWYIERELTSDTVRPYERDLRTYMLRTMLGLVEPREIRARLGYYRPGWTPREAIHKGLLVLINGARLINQRNTQHYLFTQAYSLIMQEINKRTPGNPNDKPVALVMDEVYSLLSIPGMAEEVGMLSPLYRSRKLELYVVLQALSQLAPNLRQQIWSIGNLVSFAVSDFNEAYDIAQQLFKYESRTVKLPPKTEQQQPVTESDRGQYLNQANWIQRLNHRECILRRYYSEQQQDKYIRHVPKTLDTPPTRPDYELLSIKESLLKERGVSVRDALEVVNQRKLTFNESGKKPPQV